MFDFKKSIDIGKQQAALVENNMLEIEKIFKELNKEISNAASIEIELFLAPLSDWTLIAQKLTAPKEEVGPKTARGRLAIRTKNNNDYIIGTWAQHPDGYPLTMEYLNKRTDCWDSTALITVLSEIVSSGQFWLKVNQIKSDVIDQNNKNNPDEIITLE